MAKPTPLIQKIYNNLPPDVHGRIMHDGGLQIDVAGPQVDAFLEVIDWPGKTLITVKSVAACQIKVSKESPPGIDPAVWFQNEIVVPIQQGLIY